MGATLKPLFSWRSAIADSDLPPTARHVALALSIYMSERGDSAHPGPTRLAHDTGLHYETVRQNLRLLERRGWIMCLKRGGIRGGDRLANEYVANVPDPALFDPVPEAPGAVDARCEEHQVPETVRPGAVDTTNSPSNSPSKNTPAIDDFETWWHGYPRKVDKARARAEYTARRRQGITPELLSAARDHYLASADPNYLKHPSTFLHGRDGPWSEYADGPPAGSRRKANPLGATNAARLGR